jgi:hypothetical protein
MGNILVHLVTSDTMITSYNLGLHKSSNTPIIYKAHRRITKYIKSNGGKYKQNLVENNKYQYVPVCVCYAVL